MKTVDLFQAWEEFHGKCYQAVYAYNQATAGQWEVNRATFDIEHKLSAEVDGVKIRLDAFGCSLDSDTINLPFWILDLEPPEQVDVLRRINRCVVAVKDHEYRVKHDGLRSEREKRERSQLQDLMAKYPDTKRS